MTRAQEFVGSGSQIAVGTGGRRVVAPTPGIEPGSQE